jgi:hypothetical protein
MAATRVLRRIRSAHATRQPRAETSGRFVVRAPHATPRPGVRSARPQPADRVPPVLVPPGRISPVLAWPGSQPWR